MHQGNQTLLLEKQQTETLERHRRHSSGKKNKRKHVTSCEAAAAAADDAFAGAIVEVTADDGVPGTAARVRASVDDAVTPSAPSPSSLGGGSFHSLFVGYIRIYK